MCSSFDLQLNLAQLYVIIIFGSFARPVFEYGVTSASACDTLCIYAHLCN